MSWGEPPLDALAALLDQVAGTGDLTLARSRAVEQAADRVRGSTDPEEDLGAAALLGRFHWYRSLSGDDDAKNDLAAARRFFVNVYVKSDPRIPPKQLQTAFEQEGIRPLPETMNRLGAQLLEQHRADGDPRALDEAIAALRSVVDDAVAGDSDRREALFNLSAALLRRYEVIGGEQALADFLAAAREQVAFAPLGDAQRAVRLSVSSGSLARRYAQTRDADALHEAVRLAQAAVAALDEDSPERAEVLTNACVVLRVFAEHEGGDAEALATAVEYGRRAVAVTPEGHPEHSASRFQLGMALVAWYELIADVALLPEAIDAFHESLADLDERDPRHARNLIALAESLFAKASNTNGQDALDKARSCWQAAAKNVAAPVADRISAHRHAGVVLGMHEESRAEALAAMESAVALLPMIALRAPEHGDQDWNPHQEQQSGVLGALAADVCAAAIEAGRPDRAIELLEQIRNLLIVDPVNPSGGDLARLRDVHPDLARTLEVLLIRLAVPDRDGAGVDGLHGGPPSPPTAAPGTGRREAVGAWTALVQRIRQIKGFDDFLSPPHIESLTEQARTGPIVFVVAGVRRCDALILTGDPTDQLRHVPLHGFDRDTVVAEGDILHTARRTAHDKDIQPRQRMAAQAKIAALLQRLWDGIAEPVLAALGHTAPPVPGTPWPRVRWCPVGELALLPLHAAGHHADLAADDPERRNRPRSVLDRVVSSYMVTVRALADSGPDQPDDGSVRRPGPLVVAVPDAPGHRRLAGVADVVREIARLSRDAYQLGHPTRAAVREALPLFGNVHFACHGFADLAHPSASRLILSDGDADPLTVADVIGLRLNGGLAYLSACETTVARPDLTAASVHLAGAFHLAGYREVIGTLWSVEDEMARQLTKAVYKGLSRGDDAALALHEATRELRASSGGAVATWSAFTHTGVSK